MALRQNSALVSSTGKETASRDKSRSTVKSLLDLLEETECSQQLATGGDLNQRNSAHIQ
jgi:hypothetical protein